MVLDLVLQKIFIWMLRGCSSKHILETQLGQRCNRDTLVISSSLDLPFRKVPE